MLYIQFDKTFTVEDTAAIPGDNAGVFYKDGHFVVAPAKIGVPGGVFLGLLAQTEGAFDAPEVLCMEDLPE